MAAPIQKVAKNIEKIHERNAIAAIGFHQFEKERNEYCQNFLKEKSERDEKLQKAMADLGPSQKSTKLEDRVNKLILSNIYFCITFISIVSQNAESVIAN